MRKLDLSGQEFGRLVVLHESEERKRPKAVTWVCKCFCGNIVKATRDELRSGNTKSCGCLRKEKSRKRRFKHGGTVKGRSRLYRIWQAMKQRCRDPNTNRSHIYYDRSIKVCEEWQNYEKFKKWAIKNDYSENLQIDRINNDGDYYPENCRWVTPQEQANNKRENHLLTHKGKTQTLSEWAREKGIKYHTLKARINRLNWSVKRALTEPTGGKK